MAVVALAAALSLVTACGDDEAGDDGPIVGPTVEVPSGSGMFSFDGADYPFVAETCVVDGQSLIVEGPGTTNGSTYFVRVQPSGDIEVGFGVSSADADVPQDEPLLRSIGELEVTAGVDQATVETNFEDLHDPAQAPRPGTLTATCQPMAAPTPDA